MRAWLFRIHRLADGRHAAWGVLCGEARYASVAVPGVSRLIRRHALPITWKAVGEELSLGLDPGPLPADSALSRLLIVGDAINAKAFVVQYVTSRSLTETDAGAILAALDHWLLEQPVPAV